MTGQEFKKIRNKLELTQEQLSQVIGLEWKAISNIETGFRNANKLAVAIMHALDDLPKKKVQELLDLLRKYMEK